MTNQARSDIVERLRGTADSAEEAGFTHAAEIAREAADEIERLRAELRSEREGKISQSYAAELARQVGELETENEQLRARFVPGIDAASNS